MSYPPTGPAELPPDDSQPPAAAEPGPPTPAGSSPAAVGPPYPVPQQPAGPHGAPTYSPGSAVVPPAGQRPGIGYPGQDQPTLSMPAVPADAGQPISVGPGQQGYPPVAGHAAGVPQVAGQPTQVGPPSALPYGAAVGAPSAATRGKGRVVLVLSLVAALLFVVGGLMSGLYIAKSSELDRTERTLRAQVSERDAELDAQAKEVERLKRELETANDKVAAVQQDLTGTKNDRDELERQKQVISRCFDLLGKAATATTRSAYDKAIKEANKVCDEADRYL